VICLLGGKKERGRVGAQYRHLPSFSLSLYIYIYISSRMSHTFSQSWFPLCLLLKDRGNDSAIQDSHELHREEPQQPFHESKHVKRWSTGPSFVKHCEVLKRHSFPAIRSNSSSVAVMAGYRLPPETSQPTELSTREPPTFEQPTCVLNAFMETASEDDDSLFDTDSPSLDSKAKLQELMSSPLHPQLWRAQSPPSDITQSVLSSTQSPVPSLLSETELPDFGDDFVQADEEMWSADDWEYFQVGESLLHTWRQYLANHNQRFFIELPGYNKDWYKLVDIRRLV